MEVPGLVVQESRLRRRRNPTVQTLGCNVLGQYRRSLGTVQSWDGLGTVRSWDSTFLGQWSWDSTVLGQWSWDSGLGTVVLGQ